MSASGEGPLSADPPAGRAADQTAAAPDSDLRAAKALKQVQEPQGGGRTAKSRRRRRRRRGPVYAPGMRPSPVIIAAMPAAREPAGQPESEPRPASDVPHYAALDLGTNNCRLLIAAPRDHGFRVVDAFSRIVRLGEGISRSGRLGEAAMARAIEALRICAQKLADRRVARTRLIATEACRAAENGAEFIERARAETGLALEIVSQESEARLAVAGCASLVDPAASGVILFDIGGGSSELVWIDLSGEEGGRRRRMSDRIRRWMSLPVGVVNVSERHGGGRHVTRDGFEAMVGEVAGMLAGFPEVEALDRAVAAGAVHMLGTSGTVTTLAGIHLGLPRYDRRRVDGIWLGGGEVAGLIDALAGMDYEQRVANPCIGRERADLVLAGCAILEAFRRRWPVDRLRVADRGLREGMLVELMAEDGVWRQRGRQRAGDRAGG